MKFDDSNVDASQVQDLRGGRGGGGPGRGGGMGRGATVGGLGIIGLIMAVFFGVNVAGNEPEPQFIPTQTQTQSQTRTGTTMGTGSDLATRCNQPGAIDQYEDCFITKVFNETNEIWASQVQGYRRPTLVFFERGVRTACGPASSDTGPFYCPGDDKVYIDLPFMKQLLNRLGANGRNAEAYVIAHEVGHHIQNITGQERRVRQLQGQDPRNRNALSVRMELQADCYAGVWARQANEQGKVQITPSELDQAREAAAAVGDDRINPRLGQEHFTHGSAQQRQEWFNRGFDSGDPRQCNTF